MDNSRLRKMTLASFGAGPQEIEELMQYNDNSFAYSNSDLAGDQLVDEPFVLAWRGYIKEAETKSFFEVLQHKLVQLQFPIKQGISQSEQYRAATLKGVSYPATGEGLILARPDELELNIHQTSAGAIPVLICRHRADFVVLLQALIGKNEPIDIPDSMGACMVAGYNNWDRIHTYRKEWEASMQGLASDAGWKDEFKLLIGQKDLYQDRFIVITGGPYSGVKAQHLGLSEQTWHQQSLLLRLEHESTHYYTLRMFSSMRNNMLDELIADYAGIVAVNHQFRADWFLHFIGLENFPAYREGARLQNYRGNPKLSDASFSILQALLVAAAHNLELIDKQRSTNTIAKEQVIRLLCSLTLEELASEQAEESVHAMLIRERKRIDDVIKE